MAVDQQSVLRERTNLRTILVAIAAFALGAILLAVASQESWWHGRAWVSAVIRELGALIVATVAISLLLESTVRRAILEEFWAKAKVGESVRYSGLLHVSDSFHHDIDWKALFDGTARVDLFFAYGRTWRNTHADELRRLASMEEGRLRIVLPDPDDLPTTTELGRRFSMTADQVFAVYNHQRERAPVPTFVVEQGGTLYDFVRQEFDAMIRADGGLARRVL